MLQQLRECPKYSTFWANKTYLLFVALFVCFFTLTTVQIHFFMLRLLLTVSFLVLSL